MHTASLFLFPRRPAILRSVSNDLPGVGNHGPPNGGTEETTNHDSRASKAPESADHPALAGRG